MGNYIELFRSVSTAFLILALLFLIAAIAVYFVFDIGHIIGILSGSAARKGILKMEKRNAETGQLSNHSTKREPIKRVEDVISYPATEQIVTTRSAETESVPYPAEEIGLTNVLSMPNQSYGKFLLLKSEMLVHTTESI